jgi:hypothetical protein
MLNLNGLESKLKQCFKNTIPQAFEAAFKEYAIAETEENNERAKKFGETMDAICSEAWASQIAAAIDSYLKVDVYPVH